MDRIKLTKRIVDAAQPRERPYFVSDGGANSIPGFALRVHPTGLKAFVLRYRPGGRSSAQTLQTIGEYGPLTVDEARKKGLELRANVTASRSDPTRDPRAIRRAAVAARAAERGAVTIAELCDRYLEDAAGRGLKPGTLAFLRAHLGEHMHRIGPKSGEIVPSPIRAVLGKTKAKDLTRAEIKRFYEERRSDRPASARRSVKLLRSLYGFAANEGLVPKGTDPTDGLRLAKISAPRRTALSSAEYAALGVALETARATGLPAAPARKGRSRGMSKARAAKLTGRKRGPYKRHVSMTATPANPSTVSCIEFLAVTGWRKNEARTLRWDALDRERREAILEDTKTGVSARPLGDAAWSLLDGIRACQESEDVVSPFVFVRTRDFSSPVSDLTPLWTNAASAAGLSITPHGLRHSFTTVARELGYGDHVIATLIGHALGSTQTGRYGLAPQNVVREAADQVSSAILARICAARRGAID